MSSEHDVADLTIIGGGPTGLFAAFYAGMREMRTRIIDSLDQLGGQLTTLYPEKLIYDVPGFPAVLAKTLAAELSRQALQYHPEVILGDQVQELVRSEHGWALRTDRSTYESRTVLISAGGGAFAPKRLPPELDRYEGRGLFYFVRDLAEFRERRMLVIGGGDSAVDWALNLLRVTDQVTLIHRRDGFRAHEDSLRKLHASPVTIRAFYELKRLQGDDQISSATIYDNRTMAEETIPVDAVLVNIGFLSTLGPLQNWGLAMEKGSIVVNSRMETSLPGVYAAGDIATFPGKLKLIATGFGEAAIAANHAKVFIDPRSDSFPGHSSTLIPKKLKAGR